MAESHRPQGISSEQNSGTVGGCGCVGGGRGSLPIPGTAEDRVAWMSSRELSPVATMGGPSHQDLSCHVAGTSRPEQKCLGHRARGGQRQEVRGNYIGENGSNKRCKMYTCPIESQ